MRICIVSLLRIALWRHIEGTDLTYTVSLLYLFTALEPLLGIVLASLPMMRPAGTQIIKSSILSWANPRHWTSSANLAIKKPGARDFKRLHDDSDLARFRADIEGHPLGEM